MWKQNEMENWRRTHQFLLDKLTDFEGRDIRRDGKLVLNSNKRNEIDKISVKNYSVKTGNYIRSWRTMGKTRSRE